MSSTLPAPPSSPPGPDNPQSPVLPALSPPPTCPGLCLAALRPFGADISWAQLRVWSREVSGVPRLWATPASADSCDFCVSFVQKTLGRKRGHKGSFKDGECGFGRHHGLGWDPVEAGLTGAPWGSGRPWFGVSGSPKLFDGILPEADVLRSQWLVSPCSPDESRKV